MKEKNRIGETSKNSKGEYMEIVYYKNATNVVVDFGDVLKTCTYGNFKKGNVSSKRPNARQKPISKDSYQKWHSMMQRCKNNSIGYEDVIVCDEWHSYEKFKEWYIENYYSGDDFDVALDKDILSSILQVEKIYSPETCMFIPRKINSLMIRCVPSIKSNGLPTGVNFNTWRKKDIFPYSAITSNPYTKKTMLIGIYKTKKEAYEAYINKKKEFILDELENYKDKIPTDIYNIIFNYEFTPYHSLQIYNKNASQNRGKF